MIGHEIPGTCSRCVELQRQLNLLWRSKAALTEQQEYEAKALQMKYGPQLYPYVREDGDECERSANMIVWLDKLKREKQITQLDIVEAVFSKRHRKMEPQALTNTRNPYGGGISFDNMNCLHDFVVEQFGHDFMALRLIVKLGLWIPWVSLRFRYISAQQQTSQKLSWKEFLLKSGRPIALGVFDIQQIDYAIFRKSWIPDMRDIGNPWEHLAPGDWDEKTRDSAMALLNQHGLSALLIFLTIEQERQGRGELSKRR